MEMSAGFIERTKNASFSLFFENAIILLRFLDNSAINASIGLKSPLIPFASKCAKYLESFDSNDNASFELNPKCLIMANKNSSKRESALPTSFLTSISLILISA